MFQRILVPLDGSTRAEQAIPLAARVARASGGSLHVLQVVSPLYGTGIAPYPPLARMPLEDLQEQRRASAQAYLTKTMAASALAGLEMHAAVVSGFPASAILQVVEEHHIDLVVLCSHGETGFTRWALGSVAQHVVRHCPAPVFLLREQNLRLVEKVGRPIHAAVALDGSPFAEAALLPAAHLVAALSAPEEGELLLLLVLQLPTVQERREYEQYLREVDLRHALLQTAHQTLLSAREKLVRELSDTFTTPTKPLIRITKAVLEDGDVADALLKATEGRTQPGMQQPVDLLALTTHGRSGFQRWVVGSVTERVLQGSTLPLLVVHPSQQVSPPQHSSTSLREAGFTGHATPGAAHEEVEE